MQVIARGDHGAAIHQKGLRLQANNVKKPDVPPHVQLPPGSIQVFRSADEAKEQGAPPADFVLLCVKTWQVREAAAEAAKLLSATGCVVTTQNGVEAPHEAAAAVGHDRVLACVCKVLAWVAEPGTILMEASPDIILLGEVFKADGSELRLGEAPAHPERCGELLRAFEGVPGITASMAEPCAWTAIWEKACIMCCLGPVCALARAPIEMCIRVPETSQLVFKAMAEVATCMMTAGHLHTGETPEQVAQRVINFGPRQAKPGATPSTLRDVVTGRPSELHELTGGIRRAGAKLGVPTTTHDLIFAALLPQEMRARKQDVYQLDGVPGGVPHITV